MSYHATGSLFDKHQLVAVELSPEELAALPPDIRLEYQARHYEVEATKRTAFWESVAGFATLAAFLGVAGWFKLGR